MTLKDVVRDVLINNYLATLEDIVIAETVYGSNIKFVNDKTTRSNPSPASETLTPVPDL